MQYLWKVTVLGTEQQVCRLISLDGNLPLDSVLSLCNLSFDFDNYPEKVLYFAKGQAGREYFDQIRPLEEDRFGAQKVMFWHPEHVASYQKPETVWQNGLLHKLDLQAQTQYQIKFASKILQEYMQVYAVELERSVEQQPTADERAACFIYQLHGVNLFVEVMKSAEKLMCFVPATLAGSGLVTDEQQNLSLANLQAQLQHQQELEEQSGEGTVLDLRACTARMRALQTSLDSQRVNQALVAGGAAPLKFTSH